MSFSKFYIFIFGFLIFFPFVSLSAKESVLPMEIKAIACESLQEDEAKSTARVRVTDKATFNAISEIPQLKSYKEKLDSHDFNVMVYTIVDEYIEDFSVKTTEQSDEKICVEIHGFVNPTNVQSAIDATLKKQAVQEEISDDKTTENTALLSDEITDHLNKTNPINNDDFIPPSQENESNISTESSDLLGRLYVAPVAFFNNTTSDYHAQLIVDSFKNAYNYEIVDSPNDADYLIKTSVLRAKVDALNNSTSRLQMVIAMELSFKDGTSSQTIHQNRFVVFENSENEQNVALKLLTKLFNNAVEQIEVYMQKHEKEKGNIPVLPSVITPSSLSDTNKDFSSFE